VRRHLLPLLLLFATGCAGMAPAEDAPSDIEAISLALAEGEPEELEPALSADQVRSLRRGFSWGRVTPLALRDPQNQHAVRYAVISIESKEQLEALDILGLHWDSMPLFAEEQAKWSGKKGFVTLPQDDEGALVFALIPAKVYNELRAHQAAGEELFKIVELRDVPASARNADGSVSYTFLKSNAFVWRAQPKRATLNGPIGVSRQPLLGSLLHKVAKAIADAASDVIDGVREGVGAGDAWINGSVRLDVGVQWRAAERPLFTQTVRLPLIGDVTVGLPLVQGWGARRGLPVGVKGVQVRASQGISLFTAETNALNQASMRVVKNRSTSFCLEMESDAVEITTNTLLPKRVCSFPSQSFDKDGPVTLIAQDKYSNVLATVSDAANYLKQVNGVSMRHATILMGGAAGLASPSGRAFAPCASVFNWKASIASVALDLIPLVNLVWLPADWLLDVDIVLPNTENTPNSRGVAVHEYGHVALCNMMANASLTDFGTAWTNVMVETLTAQDTSSDSRGPEHEASWINESFADFIASQVAGGTDYYNPPNDFAGLKMHYCNALSSDCVEHNENDATTFDGALAQSVTLLTDVFDGQFRAGDVPGNGGAWSLAPDNRVLPGSVAAPHAYDEVVALQGTWLPKIFEEWSARDNRLHKQSWYQAIAAVMKRAGYNDSQVCRAFAIHELSGQCPAFLGLSATANDVSLGDLTAPVGLTARLTGNTATFGWQDISLAGAIPPGATFTYEVKQGATVITSGSRAYQRVLSPALTVSIPANVQTAKLTVRTRAGARTSGTASISVSRPQPTEDPCDGPAAAHIFNCQTP
jgi:hypothetical protein